MGILSRIKKINKPREPWPPCQYCGARARPVRHYYSKAAYAPVEMVDCCLACIDGVLTYVKVIQARYAAAHPPAPPKRVKVTLASIIRARRAIGAS